MRIRKELAFTFLLFIACEGNYNPIYDTNIIPDFKKFSESDKFVFVIYYNNPFTYRDAPLSVYRIRDGNYEHKIETTIYKDELEYFLSKIFIEKSKILKNNISYHYLNTVCDIKNQKNEILLWYSYEPIEKTMILNGKLFKTNVMLMNFTKTIIEHSDYMIPN